MTEAAIHRMVAQRLTAKMNRQFDVADKLQAEMANSRQTFLHPDQTQECSFLLQTSPFRMQRRQR